MVYANVWWLFLLLGLAAGTMGAMLGVGGGILMVPMLIWAASIPDKQARTWSLAVMIPMALAATFRNVANQDHVGRIEILPVGLMALGAIGGAYIGSMFLKDFSGLTLKRLFAVLLVASAVKMAFFSRGDAPVKPGTPGATAPGDATDPAPVPGPPASEDRQ